LGFCIGFRQSWTLGIILGILDQGFSIFWWLVSLRKRGQDSYSKHPNHRQNEKPFHRQHDGPPFRHPSRPDTQRGCALSCPIQ
jgi:hypothetical protein